MEAIVFIGLQAAGKSSFYRDRFFATHVRISLDLLRTRHRELRMLQLCLETDQPFVVDNTNPTPAERARYVTQARTAGFRVAGYYFQSQAAHCLQRNAARANPVPKAGLLGTASRMVRPSFQEGFDELYYVAIVDHKFRIERWNDEV